MPTPASEHGPANLVGACRAGVPLRRRPELFRGLRPAEGVAAGGRPHAVARRVGEPPQTGGLAGGPARLRPTAGRAQQGPAPGRLVDRGGLADGLERYAALIQAHWPTLHPQCLEDGMEPRLGSLDWLQHQVRQALRRVPLLQEGEQGLDQNALEAARRSLDATGSGPEEWARRVRRSDASALGQVRRAVNRLPSALQTLEQAVDACLGADGPGFAATRDAVAATVALVERLARERGLESAPVVDGRGPSEAEAPVSVDPQAQQPPTGVVRTRAQALGQLRAVAAFFRETEPHSPVAYLADRAARWGEMPLHEWLRTVMKDGAGLNQLEELLGVSGDDRVA